MNVCVWWQGPGRGEEDMHRALQGKVKHGLGGVKSRACCTTHIKQTKKKQKTEQNRKDTTKRLSVDSVAPKAKTNY